MFHGALKAAGVKITSSKKDEGQNNLFCNPPAIHLVSYFSLVLNVWHYYCDYALPNHKPKDVT